MLSIEIFLPDGSIKEFSHNPTVLEVAQSIGAGLAKATLGARINGNQEVIDLRTPLEDKTKIQIITTKDKESLQVIRHSAAHIMAEAVQELWDDVKVTIGPVIENGFYYDFDCERTFTPEDLVKIEKKLKEIIKRDDVIKKEVWSTKKAIEVFSKMGEEFKVEIIKDLGIDEVSIYTQGSWFDLCRGPHVQRTSQLKAVKILHTAGAYWRGNENNKQLQRIYATAFNDKKDLAEHLSNLEEAKKRDHRKLGKQLGLIYFHPFSPGAPFFTEKGTIIYNELQKFIREQYIKRDYGEVVTPQIFDVELYLKSGHYENYRENMYFSRIDEREFAVKPMNCPGHCLLYGAVKKSYRDLPWRVADFGRLHRHEKSGALQGLTRVTTLCQDDAHIFCTVEQLQDEIIKFIEFLSEVYKILGMDDYEVFLSTRPKKRMGSEEIWDASEKALEDALNSMNLKYTLNPGDGAFYGPKLDIMFVDALKRSWQLGTLQCDFNMPKAFNLSYVGEDNQNHQPVMLHRAILGSFERFIGVYIEHCAGKFPLWLSPVQVIILNVTDRQNDYCHQLVKDLKGQGVRVHFDSRNEKLGFKIREAQLQKIPYMLTIGEKEVEAGTVSVRLLSGETQFGIVKNEFIESVAQKILLRENKL